MARKAKDKMIFVGTISAMSSFKAAQPWMGNQRGMVHKSKNDYKRKDKYPNKDSWD